MNTLVGISRLSGRSSLAGGAKLLGKLDYGKKEVPDGTFKLTSVTKFSLKHVMEHVTLECHVNVSFFRKFVTLGKFKKSRRVAVCPGGIFL